MEHVIFNIGGACDIHVESARAVGMTALRFDNRQVPEIRATQGLIPPAAGEASHV